MEAVNLDLKVSVEQIFLCSSNEKTNGCRINWLVDVGHVRFRRLDKEQRLMVQNTHISSSSL